MKIFFTRHGEAMDDIENKYGGWYDPELSPAGIKGAQKAGHKLKEKATKADLILSSPLKRATQTAEGIAKELNLPIETFVYLKERNTYGLLCGVNKDEAKQKYPDLVNTYQNDQEVLGYEPYDFFLKRVKELIKKLKSRPEKTLICVTHSKLLATLFKDILGIKAKKFHDNCIAEIDIDKHGSLNLITTDGTEI